eukprot:CAMPEP_0179251188 /NCGR_PEP_ID=MMETSP0797-20121207/21557_1 /TAXON_ID=47934 /ORGANISM="Dinophysis acuminata, Strain DAEP01" /LENGTH=173 /DNA_ID=CAMNT_0020958953 /DNA_START=1316 /DNA_END=1834 /DNA_ORIENTATION=-
MTSLQLGVSLDTSDMDDVRLPRRVGGMAELNVVTGTVCAGSTPFVKVGRGCRGCRAEASDGDSGGGDGTGVDSGVAPGDGAAGTDAGSGGEPGGGGGAAAGVDGGFGDGACERFAAGMCSGSDDRKNRTQTKPMLSTTDNTRMALCQPCTICCKIGGCGQCKLPTPVNLGGLG